MKLDIHNPGNITFMFKSKSKTLNCQQNGNVRVIILPLLMAGFKAGEFHKLFRTCVCLMQKVILCFAHHCPFILHCLNVPSADDLHGAKALFFTGNLVKLFFSTTVFQFRSHHLPKFQTPGLLPSAWTWCHGDTLGCALKTPGGISLHRPRQSPHSVYSHFVLKQANNSGGRKLN